MLALLTDCNSSPVPVGAPQPVRCRRRRHSENAQPIFRKKRVQRGHRYAARRQWRQKVWI